MRNDHVFYGHIGSRYPTAEEIEHHLHAARRLRSDALHELLRNAWRSIASLFRREAPKLQHC